MKCQKQNFRKSTKFTIARYCVYDCVWWEAAMTANQVAYWKLQEEKRSNLAKENETNRSNVAKENLTDYSNKVNLANTIVQGVGKIADSIAKFGQSSGMSTIIPEMLGVA